MRDFWHFVNWINDESGETANKKLKPFLAGTIFKLSYKFKKGADDKILELDLWDTKYRDTCKPSYERDNFGFDGGTGKTDLLLYRLGGGETANTLDPKQKDTPARVMNPRLVFDGIVVVRMKLAFKFEDDTHVWDVNGISTWIKQFVQKPLTDLTQFYWECSRDHAFKRIIMLFVPHFTVYDAPIPAPPGDWVTAVPADSHFNFTVKANPGKAPAAFNGAGKNISVDYDVDKSTVTRYLVGKTAAGAVGKNDFGSIATWLKDTLGLTPLSGGGLFTIKDLP